MHIRPIRPRGQTNPIMRTAADGLASHSPSGVALPSPVVYAFQPIVDSHSGAVYAYEALMRGTDAAGFASIDAFFDHAAAQNRVWETERALQDLAFTTFRRWRGGTPKLFLNIDSRAFADPAFAPSLIADAAARMGVPPASVIIELSEKHAAALSGSAVGLARQLRAAGLRIALDDFGQGYSELSLLYEAAPEYVKIDRFFICGIATSPRKRLFVTTIVNLAHVLGSRVIAEGVETEEEFLTCREIGCDFTQGWFIARPMRDLTDCPSIYLLPRSAGDDPSEGKSACFLPRDYENVTPIAVTAPVGELLDRFGRNPGLNAIPVISAEGAPLGLVLERDFRAEIYGRRAPDVAGDHAPPPSIGEFITRVPVVDQAARFDEILDRVGMSAIVADGALIAENQKYVGYVSARTLISLINERRLMIAQDQNPLSHLPGNASINGHLLTLGNRADCDRIFCYFDFNHFKPFNDTYGFRLGDRAIMLFADILRRHLGQIGGFLGHIGGDDFFAAFSFAKLADIEAETDRVLADFREEIQSFYSTEDRANGFLLGEDRDGRPQIYPLMTCSVAIMHLPAGEKMLTLDTFSRAVAAAKRAAKMSPNGRVSRSLCEACRPQ